jgi:hypothetical protein
MDWLSLEVSPMMASNSLVYDYSQSGGGVGFSLGIWPEGRAFQGWVLRPILQVNSMKYTSNYGGPFNDPSLGSQTVNHTEMIVGGEIGSHHRIKFFTLAWGFGLGVDTNVQKNNEEYLATGAGDHSKVVAKVHFVDMGRLSLGVIF